MSLSPPAGQSIKYCGSMIQQIEKRQSVKEVGQEAVVGLAPSGQRSSEQASGLQRRYSQFQGIRAPGRLPNNDLGLLVGSIAGELRPPELKPTMASSSQTRQQMLNMGKLASTKMVAARFMRNLEGSKRGQGWGERYKPAIYRRQYRKEGNSPLESENRKNSHSFEYYKSQLKPYYMDNIQYDRNGNIKRSISPNQILDSFDPLPSYDTLQKINYYIMPYNQLQHTEKFMTFDEQSAQKKAKDNGSVAMAGGGKKKDNLSDLCITDCAWKHVFNFICKNDRYSDVKGNYVLNQIKTYHELLGFKKIQKKKWRRKQQGRIDSMKQQPAYKTRQNSILDTSASRKQQVQPTTRSQALAKMLSASKKDDSAPGGLQQVRSSIRITKSANSSFDDNNKTGAARSPAAAELETATGRGGAMAAEGKGEGIEKILSITRRKSSTHMIAALSKEMASMLNRAQQKKLSLEKSFKGSPSHGSPTVGMKLLQGNLWAEQVDGAASRNEQWAAAGDRKVSEEVKQSQGRQRSLTPIDSSSNTTNIQLSGHKKKLKQSTIEDQQKEMLNNELVTKNILNKLKSSIKLQFLLSDNLKQSEEKAAAGSKDKTRSLSEYRSSRTVAFLQVDKNKSNNNDEKSGNAKPQSSKDLKVTWSNTADGKVQSPKKEGEASAKVDSTILRRSQIGVLKENSKDNQSIRQSKEMIDKMKDVLKFMAEKEANERKEKEKEELNDENRQYELFKQKVALAKFHKNISQRRRQEKTKEQQEDLMKDQSAESLLRDSHSSLQRFEKMEQQIKELEDSKKMKLRMLQSVKRADITKRLSFGVNQITGIGKNNESKIDKETSEKRQLNAKDLNLQSLKSMYQRIAHGCHKNQQNDKAAQHHREKSSSIRIPSNEIRKNQLAESLKLKFSNTTYARSQAAGKSIGKQSGQYQIKFGIIPELLRIKSQQPSDRSSTEFQRESMSSGQAQRLSQKIGRTQDSHEVRSDEDNKPDDGVKDQRRADKIEENGGDNGCLGPGSTSPKNDDHSSSEKDQMNVIHEVEESQNLSISTYKNKRLTFLNENSSIVQNSKNKDMMQSNDDLMRSSAPVLTQGSQGNSYQSKKDNKKKMNILVQPLEAFDKLLDDPVASSSSNQTFTDSSSNENESKNNQEPNVNIRMLQKQQNKVGLNDEQNLMELTQIIGKSKENIESYEQKESSTFTADVCNKCRFCKQYDHEVLAAIIRLYEEIAQLRLVELRKKEKMKPRNDATDCCGKASVKKSTMSLVNANAPALKQKKIDHYLKEFKNKLENETIEVKGKPSKFRSSNQTNKILENKWRTDREHQLQAKSIAEKNREEREKRLTQGTIMHTESDQMPISGELEIDGRQAQKQVSTCANDEELEIQVATDASKLSIYNKDREKSELIANIEQSKHKKNSSMYEIKSNIKVSGGKNSQGRLFRKVLKTRNSRMIMNEPYPVVDSGGNVKRNVPGLQSSEKLFNVPDRKHIRRTLFGVSSRGQPISDTISISSKVPNSNDVSNTIEYQTNVNMNSTFNMPKTFDDTTQALLSSYRAQNSGHEVASASNNYQESSNYYLSNQNKLKQQQMIYSGGRQSQVSTTHGPSSNCNTQRVAAASTKSSQRQARVRAAGVTAAAAMADVNGQAKDRYSQTPKNNYSVGKKSKNERYSRNNRYGTDINSTLMRNQAKKSDSITITSMANYSRRLRTLKSAKIGANHVNSSHTRQINMSNVGSPDFYQMKSGGDRLHQYMSPKPVSGMMNLNEMLLRENDRQNQTIIYKSNADIKGSRLQTTSTILNNDLNNTSQAFLLNDNDDYKRLNLLFDGNTRCRQLNELSGSLI